MSYIACIFGTKFILTINVRVCVWILSDIISWRVKHMVALKIDYFLYIRTFAEPNVRHNYYF